MVLSGLSNRPKKIPLRPHHTPVRGRVNMALSSEEKAGTAAKTGDPPHAHPQEHSCAVPRGERTEKLAST